MSGRQLLFDGPVTLQDAITLASVIEAASIVANLPEILQPLYALFDFIQLPAARVVNQAAEMRGQRF